MGGSIIYKFCKCMFIAVMMIMSNSCGNSSTKPKTDEPSKHGYYNDYPYNRSKAVKSQSTKPTSSMHLTPYSDSYDDGYQDGEAAAEEDRLAGKPGMQSGGDDGEDDDDYEDGYDDGYEDY